LTQTIDFETRSRADLTKCGLYKYAADPSTELLCMARGETPADVKVWVPVVPGTGQKVPFPAAKLDGHILHAHNASFERAILREKCGLALPPSRFRCSAAGAIQSGLARSLEACSELLSLETAKDSEGHEIMKKLVKPGKKGEFDEDPDKYKRLYSYCRDDVRAEMCLEAKLPKIQEFMQAAWEAHEHMNDRGIPIDRDLVVGAAKIAKELGVETSNDVFHITNGTIKTGGQRDKIIKFLKDLGVELPFEMAGNRVKDKLDAAAVSQMLDDPDLDPTARKILLLRKASSGAAAKKHTAILEYLMADDRIRGSYVFPGTHTGRCASWGVQVMNLKKMTTLGGFPVRKKDANGNKCAPWVDQAYLDAMRSGKLSAMRELGPEYAKFDILTLLGVGVRAAIAAKPGHTFIFRDLSQIEVRLAHWFTRNKQIMQLFRDKGDIYKDFASKFFGVPVSEVTDNQRQLSKPIVLGCNYGMGKVRLAVYAKTYGLTLTEDEADVYVQAFRRLYPLIPKLWKYLEAAAIACVKDGKTRKIGVLFAGVEGRFFYFQLPSGRRIYYLDPEIHEGKYGEIFCFTSHHGHTEHTWGGTFLENLCQAGCADLANLGVTRAEEAGLCPIINQHDEIGCEVPTASLIEAGHEFGKCMEMGAEWTQDLPVGSDLAVQERWIK
jgi:DNA polymerase